jgi:hypothetical protein
MSEEVKGKLIDLFWESIEDWTWGDWCSTSSKDKEEIVVDAIADLGLEVDIDEAYDLFYEWASGLDESSFDDYYDEYGDEEV